MNMNEKGLMLKRGSNFMDDSLLNYIIEKDREK